MPNFFVSQYRKDIKVYPTDSFILSTDYWDDVGYETKFHMSYKDLDSKTIYLGEVKIGFLDQKSKNELKNISLDTYEDATFKVIDEEFTKLEPNFFSLGQSPEYYENIFNLFKGKTRHILSKLNDLSLKPYDFKNFEEQGVVKYSLLRSVSKWQIKNQFYQIINGRSKLTNFKFSFKYRDKFLMFEVEALSKPPTNIHALIGRNGAGKTTILNCMLEELLVKNKNNKFNTSQTFDYNQIRDEDFFSKAIYISYSVFGKYLPAYPNDTSFSYIGLKERKGDDVTIKNMDELYKEFDKSLNIVRSSLSLDKMFHTVLFNISESYDNDIVQKLAGNIEGNCEKSGFNKVDFIDLSSGHAIVLLVIVNLIANVTEKTLILFDEPETHLHPPLLSALVRAINFILTEKNGICIFATHSPVLVQEIPRSCVQVVRRSGESIRISRPVIESFGENVSTLTHEIFSLEVKNSGFYKLMKKNFDSMNGDIEEIIEDFNDELGSEAISLLYSLKSNNSKFK